MERQNDKRIKSSYEKIPERNLGIKAVLGKDEFRKLWIGQIFSQLADKFYIVLMVYLIAQYWVNIYPENSDSLSDVASIVKMGFETKAQKITLLATGIYVSNTLPALLFGTFAGVIADRYSKKKLMIYSNSLRALLVLLTPICLLPGPTWFGLGWGYFGLLIITFLESTLTQFFAPAEQAAIPLLISKEYLLAANSIYQSTCMGATIIGFAIGEPILILLKKLFLQLGLNGGEFILLPICYGIAALIISRIFITERNQSNSNIDFWMEIREGFAVLKERPKVRFAIINLVFLYSLLAALYVLSISIASYIEVLGPTKFGTLLAISSLGMVCGAVVIAEFGNHFSKSKIASTGLGMITFCLISLGQAKGLLGLNLFLCFVLGIGAALVAIPAQTTLQEDTPEGKRGKVFGLQNNLINVALSVPLVIAGALISQLGLNPVLLLLAGIALIGALLEKPWQKRC